MTTSPKVSRLQALIDATHRHAAQLKAQLRALSLLNARRRKQLAALQARKAIRLFGLDYTNLTPTEAKRRGAQFVCRYLSYDPSKNISRGEARALKSLGIHVVVVWETTATRAKGGFAAGAADARQARQQAMADLGKPTDPDWCIYFAVDFDAAGHPEQVDEYFRGVASVLSVNHSGPYGSYEVCEHLWGKGFHQLWQTYAWSNGKWGHARLQQYDNNNSRFDLDRATDAYYGQWC